jgi:hypothetical protein
LGFADNQRQSSFSISIQSRSFKKDVISIFL